MGEEEPEEDKGRDEPPDGVDSREVGAGEEGEEGGQGEDAGGEGGEEGPEGEGEVT